MPQEPELRRLPAWKKIIFSVATFCGFFLLIEAGLAVVGVTPIAADRDPYIGFAGSIPLYAPDDEPGWLRTAPSKRRWFNDVRFQAEKPDGVYRIFSLGGSTTYGRPFDDAVSFSGWLREYLTGAEPGRQFEVINAGGVSYASYRVAAVLDELADYQPDLFIVYTGHNEFLERRTYGEILQVPAPLRALGGLASHSRLYAAGEHLLARSQRAEAVLEPEVDTILDRSVGPQDYHRDDAFSARVVEHFRFNLERMVETARANGAQILFVTPASNLRSCAPFKSEPAGLPGPPDLPGIEAALAAEPRRADLLYAKGQLLYITGSYAESLRVLQQALDEDVCPLRATTPIVETVRQIAQEKKVPLVDFQTEIAKVATHGIPGDDYFLDHVHLTAEGYGLLARKIFAALRQEGIVHSDPPPDSVSAIEKRVLARIDPHALAVSYRNLARILWWAGKPDDAGPLAEKAAHWMPDDPESLTLYGRYLAHQGDNQAATEEFELALAADPIYVDARIRLGTALLKLARPGEAEDQLRQALELTPDSVTALNNLGLALAAQSRIDEALEVYLQTLQLHPDSAETHSNLGLALLSLGPSEQAVQRFEAALQLEPDNPLYLSNIGLSLVQLHRISEALVPLRRAAELRPSDAQIQFNYGVALHQNGDVEEAVAQYKKAVELNPDHAEAHHNLGIALELSGQAQEAVAHFRRAAELGYRSGY